MYPLLLLSNVTLYYWPLLLCFQFIPVFPVTHVHIESEREFERYKQLSEIPVKIKWKIIFIIFLTSPYLHKVSALFCRLLLIKERKYVKRNFFVRTTEIETKRGVEIILIFLDFSPQKVNAFLLLENFSPSVFIFDEFLFLWIKNEMWLRVCVYVCLFVYIWVCIIIKVVIKEIKLCVAYFSGCIAVVSKV